jgi:UDP-N-acetylglucosamine 2-epimerase
VTGLAEADEQIIFPVHPRTRKTMGKYMLVNSDLTSKNLTLIDPVSYLDMVMLMQSARMILTDSGGIQKEAYCLGIPCITLREETEWIETVQAGWNILTGAATVKIINALRSFKPPAARPSLYGDGHAAEKVVDILSRK